MAGLGTLTLDLVARTGNFSQSMKQAGDSAERESKRIEHSIGSAMDSIKGLGAAAVAGITVSSIISSADSYVQLADRIRNATTSAAEYRLVQDRLFETANSTYRALSEAQEVYLGLAGGMKALGYATNDTLDVADSLSFSFVANAARADQAQSAIDAFGKSMAKGKVDADAWISIVTAADNVIADMAKTIGKTEVEIRKLGAEGKISLEDLIKTLAQTRDQNKELADNIKNSAADGWTVLSNSVRRYVGELNDSYEATHKVAAVMGFAAENINTVAVAGGVMAAVMAGRVAQGYAASIAASIEKKAVLQQEQQAELQLMAVQVQRTRQSVAQALTEVNLARAEFNAATTTTARAAANQRLITANMNLAISEKQAAVATSAYTASQVAATGATTALARARQLLFSLTGGWVGLAVTVAGAAASYLMLNKSADDATKALRENGESVSEAIAKYEKLDETSKRVQLRKEKDSLKELTKAYDDTSDKLISMTLNLYRSGEADAQVAKQVSNLAMEYKNGGLDADGLSAKINSLNGITEHGRKIIDDQAKAVNGAKNEMSLQKNMVEQLIPKNDSLAQSHNGVTTAINGQISAQQKLNAEQQSAYDKMKTQLERENYIKVNMEKRGISRERAEFDADLRASAKMGFTNAAGKMPESLRKIGDDVWELEQQTKARKKAEQESLETQKAQTKELGKQAEATKRLIGISGDSGIGKAHVHLQYGGVKKGQRPTLEHMNRVLVDGKKLSSFPITSDIGHRNTGIKGASTNHRGVDFGVSKGRKLTTSAAVRDIKTWFDKNGGGYVSTITYEDGVILEILHQSPEIMGKVKGGATSGTGSAKDELKSYDDAERLAAEQARSRLSLETNIADEVTRIRMNLAEDIKEIDKAGYSDTEASALKAKYHERAENDVAIAQLALKTKVDSYSDYLKTEEQLLRESYAARQVETLNDFEMSKADRKKASDHLLQQLQIEAEAIKRSEDFQVNSAFEAYLNQSEIVVKRYALERDEIAKTYRLTEATRQKLLEANKMGTFQELNNASSVVSQMGLEAAQATMQRMNPQQFAQYQLQNQYSQSSSDLMDAYNNQVSGISQLEDEQQRNAELLAAHEQYLQARAALDEQHAQQEKDLKDAQLDEQLASAEAGFGSLTEMLRKSGDERSGIYRTMLVMEKSAAIARSIMAIQTGIAMASAEPFPANIAAMASVAAATANIVSSIQSVSAGFYDGGYTGDGGKYVAAGIVHKGEVVWSQEDIARWGGVANVESMRLGRSLGGYSDGGVVGSTSTTSFPNIDFSSSQSAPTVNIHTLPGQTADVEWSDGVLEVRMRKVAEDVNKQSWKNLARPSSNESKAIRQHTTAGPRR